MADQQEDPLAEALKKAQQEADEKKKGEDGKIQDESELAKCKEELARMTENAQRALADLNNFKRRTEEERSAVVILANLELLREIIPSIDNFKRALEQLPESSDEASKNWIDGITNTFKQLKESLTRKGLEEINKVGANFDPNLHEAVLQGPGEKDKVVEVLETGYKLGERVIRHAKVKVGNGE